MFGSIARKATRLQSVATRTLTSGISTQAASKSGMRFAVALGAVGAASLFLVRRHLQAKEEEGGFLYSW